MKKLATKCPRCKHCGAYHAGGCILQAQAEEELRKEAARRYAWARLQEKFGGGWWKHAKDN